MISQRWDDENLGSVGRIRGTQRLLGSDGSVGVLAIDHGASFTRRLTRLLGRVPSSDEVTAEKQRIIGHLAPASTGIVCDTGVLPMAVRSGLTPPDVGLVAGLPDLPSDWYLGQQLPWPRDVVKRMSAGGCDAIKLCILADSPEVDRPRLELAADMSAACSEVGLAMVLEILPSDDLKRRGTWGQAATIDGNAGQFAAEYGKAAADVLKLHLPAASGDDSGKQLLEACRRITGNSPCPWVILSAGATFEVFRKQLKIACQGGASGFVAGTAIWQEALEVGDPAARDTFLRDVAVPRLRELRAIVSACVPSSNRSHR